MDLRSITNILAVLRFLKGHSGQSAAQVLSTIAREAGLDSSTSAILRMASQIAEQAQIAQIVIANSIEDEEAQQGLVASLHRFQVAFSLDGINTKVGSTIGDIDGMITNFVILLGSNSIPTRTETPQEAVDLASDCETLVGEFEDANLDPVVRELARQHLQILATMLRHIPVFGLEAAMATYFELVFKLRRADGNSAAPNKEAAKPLMEKITNLQTKLSALDKLWNVGARWVGHAKTAASLIEKVMT